MEPDVRKRQIMVGYTIGAVVGVLLLQYFWASYSQVETIPYSQFEQLLDQGEVAEVTVAADSVRGTLNEPLPRATAGVLHGPRRSAARPTSLPAITSR